MVSLAALAMAAAFGGPVAQAAACGGGAASTPARAEDAWHPTARRREAEAGLHNGLRAEHGPRGVLHDAPEPADPARRPARARPHGRGAHFAWLTGASGTEPVDGPNHRGYPTIQLQKRAAGACATPCLIQFWARVDGFALEQGEWLSLATFTPDPSDRWARVVTVNVGWEGWLHLFHVPEQGLGERAC
jgi:hypothetical protein